VDNKPRFEGRFVPYRKDKSPTPPVIDQARADLVIVCADEMQQVVLAMDVYPDRGAITVRDSMGTIWEVSFQRSDAKWLACEKDIKGTSEKTVFSLGRPRVGLGDDLFSAHGCCSARTATVASDLRARPDAPVTVVAQLNGARRIAR
jgi:hypothetical protein